MGHKCFISFKTQDMDYKNKLQNMDIDMIDKSLNEPINSTNSDYIMKKIRKEHLQDSTVTLCLIGKYSAENCSSCIDQTYIKRELQASLYDNPNGILGIVLPNMYERIYKGEKECPICGEKHDVVNINDNTTIKEFNYNYYIPKNYGCAWSEDERYCIDVKWDDFIMNPNRYIDRAYEKRTEPISKKIKVFPK